MKPFFFTIKGILSLFVFSLFTTNILAQTTIISYGSTWKYLATGLDEGTSWKNKNFNDAAWPSGAAELGYGDAPVTTVPYGPDANNKYITTYFRQSVNISNPLAYSGYTLNVRRDDGIVVYINGVERFRNNMPGTSSYNTLASTNCADDGAAVQTISLSNTFFDIGTNVIAAEVHQSVATSTDLTFDLELTASAPPVGLINFGDTWKYLDNNTRPAGWETEAFADGSWVSGPSELGYGDAPATTVSYGSDANNKYVTTYFRKSFTVTNLASYNSFTLNVVRDDGVIVYVNGVEVARDNISGVAAHGTFASTSISGTGETTPISFVVSPCAFKEGANTIAVEMHQADLTSTDLSFNLEMVGNVGGGVPTLSRGPYLQAGNETAITIRYRTSTACYGRVRVGSAVGDYTTATVTESCPTTEHIIRVTGLSPDTKYFYEVGASDGTVFQGNATNFFTTVPPINTTRKVRVAAFGDCGRNSTAYQDQTLSSYQAYLTSIGVDAADAWILMGDNAYSSGTDLEYTNNFFNIYGNNLLKTHKLYPSPGNHDYGNNSGNKPSRSMPYFNNFTVPMAGEGGGVPSNKPNYYSYNVGNIHFLSLDSWGVETDDANRDMGSAGTTALKNWIDADLAANTAKWTVAYWHHPPYTKTSHDSDNGNGSDPELPLIRANFINFLEARGVDLIICGHSHGYERGYLVKNYSGSWNSFNAATTPVSNSNAFYNSSSNCPYVYNSTPLNHGTVYIVAGSAGAAGGTHAGYAAGPMPFSINDGGVFFFETEGNRLDAKMLRRNGTIFDQFTIMKDVNQTTTYTVPTGTTLNLNASWPGQHVWNDALNSTTRSISFTPSIVGSTTFEVRDQFNCVTDEFIVNATSILPVSLVSFDVQLTGNNRVNVNWSTSTERDNKFFSIERSLNGRDFTLVGTVNAGSNPGGLQQYSFVDASPVPGTSYYRLSQTDHNNRTEYLGIRRINNVNGRAFEVKTVSSNNSQLVLEISSQEAFSSYLRVYDMSGRERKKEKLNIMPGVTRKEILLTPGVYVWEIKNQKEGTTFQKVIVQ